MKLRVRERHLLCSKNDYRLVVETDTKWRKLHWWCE